MTEGEAFWRFTRSRGLTQLQVAGLMQMKQQTVSKMFRSRKLQASTWEKIEKFFGTTKAIVMRTQENAERRSAKA